MTRMAVVTPSYRPDFELCADLNRSVLRHSFESVHHHIIVPRHDLTLFETLASTRTHVHCETEFLPRSFVRSPVGNFVINLSRPVPPVRGWILQQIIKLSAAATATEDVLLLVDSDVEFIRQFTPEMFVRDGVVRFYRTPYAVNERLPRHIIWHRVARNLLGLPQTPPPFADYVWSLVPCNPAIVRRLLARIEMTTGRSWTSVIASQLNFSEWTLYGAYVDEIEGATGNSFASDDPLCPAHWDPAPLNNAGAASFLGSIRPTDVAAMISAKSRTPLSVRRAAFLDYNAGRIVGSR